MDTQAADLNNLRQLIGRHVRYQQQLYEIVEVLNDGPSLALKVLDIECILQTDQYHQGGRWVPEVITLQVLADDKQSLSEAYQALQFIAT